MTVSGAPGGKPEPRMATNSLDSTMRRMDFVENREPWMVQGRQVTTPKTYPGIRVAFGGQAKTKLHLGGLGQPRMHNG